MNSSVGAPACSWTTWESQSFSMIVRMGGGTPIVSFPASQTGPLPHGRGSVSCRIQRLSAGTGRPRAQPIATHTDSPTCSVVAGAPEGRKSAVTLPLARTDSMADSTADDSSFNPKLYSSMAATEPIAPSGLALFCPAMSGAEPWTGSYRPTHAPEGFFAPMDAEGSMPMEPAR